MSIGGHEGSDNNTGKWSQFPWTLGGGLGAGLLAFAGVYALSVVTTLYEAGLLWDTGEAVAHPEALIRGSFVFFNSAHIGAGRRLLVLLERGVVTRVPWALLYVGPPAVLTVAGGLLTWLTDHGASQRGAVIRGAMITAGYLTGVVLVLLYLFLQRPFPVGPAVQTIVIAGLIYPSIFGGLGGGVAGRGTGSTSDQTPRKDSHPGPGSGTTQGSTPTDDPTQREGGRTTSTAARTPSGENPPYFQETLAYRVPGGVYTAAGAGALVHVILGGVLISLGFANTGSKIVAAIWFGPFVGVFGYYLSRVYVEVTDAGVKISDAKIKMAEGVAGAEDIDTDQRDISLLSIPFEEISRVQPSDSIQSLLDDDVERPPLVNRDLIQHQLQGDSDTVEREFSRRTFIVMPSRFPVSISYRTGVKIERENDPPVFVGSARPEELATTVRTRNPHTDQEPTEAFETTTTHDSSASTDRTSPTAVLEEEGPVGYVLGWWIGIPTFLFGLTGLLIQPLWGLWFIGTALVAIPRTRTIFENKLGTEIGLKHIALVYVLGIGGLFGTA